MATKTKTKHPLASPGEGSDPFLDKEEAIKHLKSSKFTPKEYVDLLSGKYGHELDNWAHGKLIDAELSDHYKYKDNKELNDKVLENLGKKFVSGKQDYPTVSSLAKFLSNPNFKISKEKFLELINNKDLDPASKIGILSQSFPQNKWSPDELSHFLLNEDLPEEAHRNIYFNKDTPEKSVNEFFEKQANKDGFHRPIAKDLLAYAQHDKLKNDNVKKAIDEVVGGGSGASHHVVPALRRLPENERKSYIDKILGIEGGEQEYSPDDVQYDDPEDYKYNNWKHGPGHNRDASTYLADSNLLNDEQINHLIKHGSDESKVNLFFNPHLKPEHYKEIYNKFNLDHGGHGYNKDKLIEKIREDKDFSKWDDYRDEAREKAQDNYTLEDFLKNQSDKDIIDIANEEASKRSQYSNQKFDPTDLMGEVANKKMEEEHAGNWKGENPNFDPEKPESEDNPKEIDYENHPEYSVQDHPEFENRERDIYDSPDFESDFADAIREKWNRGEMPDRVYEHYDEAIADDEANHVNDLFNDDLENAMGREHMLPKHITENVPEFKEAKELARKEEEKRALEESKRKERELSGFLDEKMPERKSEHEYGPGQHFIEMAKDYADANNGAVDIGTLNKLHPNNKEHWKEIFGDKGKLSSEELEQKIKEHPKQKFDISYGKWGANNMQNLNGQDEVVVRLDHSDDSLKDINADPGMKKMFDVINEMAQRSGHPSNPRTIAWARLDPTDKKHWFVDELQSDFESSARNYLNDHDRHEDASHLGKIQEMQKNWRENLMNHIVKLAKLNGVEKISTHSDESKAAHTGSDKVHSVYQKSYRQVPRQLGFKPSKMEELPLSEEGKETFKKGRASGDVSKREEAHTDAFHAHQAIGSIYREMQEREESLPDYDVKNEEKARKLEDFANHHLNMAANHKRKGLEINPENHSLRTASRLHPRPHNEEIPEFGEVGNQTLNEKQAWEHIDAGEPYHHKADTLLKEPAPVTKPHEGHTLVLSPAKLKKAIEWAEDMLRFELKMTLLKSRLSER